MVELSAHDLPAYCPNAKMPLWSWHPRVFLDVVNEREARCPYCGTRYRLAAGVRERDFDTRGLHQHHRNPPLKQVTHATQFGIDRREETNCWVDARGNTGLELITRWLRRQS